MIGGCRRWQAWSFSLDKRPQCQQTDTDQVHACMQTATRQELHWDSMLVGSMHTRPCEVAL